MSDKDCSSYQSIDQFKEDFREALGRLGSDRAYHDAFLDDPTNVTRDYCLTRGMYAALLSAYEQFDAPDFSTFARRHRFKAFRVREE